jgi:phage major head subunit gpT-like protein
MAHVSSNWSELLTPQLTEAFYIGFTDSGRRASMIPNLYRIENSQRAFEEHIGVGQFSSEGWNFEQTGRVAYDDRNKGYLKRFTHVEYAKGFVVTRKLIDDNLTSIAFNDAQELGDASFRKREKSAAQVFNNAFTDSGTDADGFAIAGADGVGLCSDAHPLSPVDTAVTADNEYTLALTKDNVRTVRQDMMAFTDDRGDILNVIPNALLVPPELEDDALVIIRSQYDPSTGNNGSNAINPQAGRFTVMPWHYLSDANAWFMIDESRMKRDLIWYERVPVEFGAEDDFDTFQKKFRAYMRYSRGFRDWRWVAGSNAS